MMGLGLGRWGGGCWSEAQVWGCCEAKPTRLTDGPGGDVWNRGRPPRLLARVTEWVVGATTGRRHVHGGRGPGQFQGAGGGGV